MNITYYFAQPDPLAPQTKARSVDINNLSNAVRVAFEKIPVTGQDWSGVHDFSGGTLRAKAPIVAADVATRGFVEASLLTAGKLPALPALGTYLLYSIDGAFSTKRAGPMNDAESLAQTAALQLAL